MLLAMNEDAETAVIRVKWEEEILARIRAVDENEVTGISSEKVIRDAEDRLTS